MNTPTRTGETCDEWIETRVAHMLTCARTKNELFDEMREPGAQRRDALLAHLHTINTTTNDNAFLRALGGIEALLQAQAADRAAGEWRRTQDTTALEAA